MSVFSRYELNNQITFINAMTPSRIEIRIPEPVMNAMKGTYRKISFLTPVLEVKVVHPVKLRAKYAVKAGIIRRKANDIKTFSQKGNAKFVLKETTAKGIATISPRMSPFVLKSCVGIKGSRAGKSTVPARTVVIAAKATRGPERK